KGRVSPFARARWSQISSRLVSPVSVIKIREATNAALSLDHTQCGPERLRSGRRASDVADRIRAVRIPKLRVISHELCDRNFWAFAAGLIEPNACRSTGPSTSLISVFAYRVVVTMFAWPRNFWTAFRFPAAFNARVAAV